MENLGNVNLFDLDGDQFIDKKPGQTKKGDDAILQLDPEKAEDKNHVIRGRFLPNPVDPYGKSKILKYYSWLTDPSTEDQFSVDCPSTVGKDSILTKTFWKLKNSESAKDQELAGEFRRRTYYYSLFLVLDDNANPQNNGKVFVFRYGTKINEMVEKELKPKSGTPKNPFSILSGREFLIDCVKKYGWNNYDNSEFVDGPTPLVIDGKAIERTPEDQEKAINWITENMPNDLSKYEFREWNNDILKKVQNVIKNTIPDGRMTSELLGAAATASAAKPAVTETKVEEVVEEPVAKNESAPVTSGIETPAATETPADSGESKEASSLDDLYADL